MKRVSFALTLTALLLSFGLSHGLIITADVSGPAVYGTPDTLNINTAFDVLITVNNDDIVRLGWSSPFRFTGTGDIDNVSSTYPAAGGGASGVYFATVGFEGIWDMFTGGAEESWDGDLSTPDQFNFSGISMAGWNPGGGAILAFEVPFTINAADTDVGTFCVDSGNFTNDVYDWLFDSPAPGFTKTCWPVALQPNAPPTFDNCPGTDLTAEWDAQIFYDFEASDIDGPLPLAFAVESGPGVIDPATGEYTFSPACIDVGSHAVEVSVVDDAGGGPTICAFTVTITNSAPTIGGDCGKVITVGTNATKTAQFSVDDPNTGEVFTWSVSGVAPSMPVGPYSIDGNGLLSFTPDNADDGIDFVFTVCVEDCAGEIDCCDVTFDVISELPFEIWIEKAHDVYQGHHQLLAVSKMLGSEEMWGFDFLIGYDVSALAFTGAIAGELFDIPGAYEWEYFTYRYNWNGNCGNGCPTGLVRVVGMADQNDGAHHPVGGGAGGALTPIADGTVLFYLDFLVTNDRNYGCMFVPVYWYWMDCGDNAVAFRYRTDIPELMIYTALAMDVYWYCCDETQDPPHYCSIFDDTYGFPGMFGPLASCFDCMDPQNPLKCPVPFVKFFGGGIDIICPEDIDDRGDVNLNGIENEIADAVVFTNYFIYGLGAFTINVEGQIAATEINGDGVPLTVGDLVYLIRVIVGDAMPLPKVAPTIDANVLAGDAITIDTEIGAALFVFDGRVDVNLGSGAAGMELKSDFVNGETRALVYSFDRGVVASGEILTANGNLVSVDAADYNGNMISANIVPAEFSLTNYPNPFNPATNIEFNLPVSTDWTLNVYNVLGQRVAEYSGRADAPGTYTVEFDGTNLATGVFFYKLTAGSYSMTEKMMLVK